MFDEFVLKVMVKRLSPVRGGGGGEPSSSGCSFEDDGDLLKQP